MSFLARLSARALPSLSRTPTVMPKGMAARRMAPVYREAAPPEEEPDIAPWRAERPLRQQEAPAVEDEKMARAAAPEAEKPEEKKPIQPARIRREPQAEPEKKEEVAPLRRAQAAEGPEDERRALPMRVIRRAEEVPLDDGEKPLRQPFQDDMMPGATPAHPDLADEQEPSSLQALRRDIAPPPQPAASAPGTPPARPGPESGFPRTDWRANDETGFAGDDAASEAGLFRPAQTPDRAQVVINQLDVLIHEPAAASAPARSQPDHSRLLRARYLRRL